MAIADSSVAADQSASLVRATGQTIELRLIHTFHVVERIIPRFRDASSGLLLETRPR